jgi:type IV pilus assembly protein PilC
MASIFQAFTDYQNRIKQRSIDKSASKISPSLFDLYLFTRQMAQLLDAGLPLITTLDTVQEQIKNPYLKAVLQWVYDDVSRGTAFGTAVRKYPRVFPNLLASMIEAGEISGTLPALLNRVSGYFEASYRLNDKVKSTLTYPIVVLSLAVLLVGAMMIFIVPIFSEMFESMNNQLPLPTQILIGASNFIKDNIIWIILTFAALIYGWTVFVKTPRGRVFKNIIIHRMPLIGPLAQKISIARFFRTYAALIRSGVPILSTIAICSTASDNTFIEAASERLKKRISEGEPLSTILKDEHYFPAIASSMAYAGEKSGKTDIMLEELAELYEADTENAINAMTSTMEPILMAIMGILIGGILVGLFMPMFEMSSAIGNAENS